MAKKLSQILSGRYDCNCIRLLKRTAFATVLMFAVTCHGEAIPSKVNLTRKAAIEMAIRNNIDLRSEALSASMARLDAKRSHSIYDPVFGASASGGVDSTPGDPFFRTRSGNATVGLTQTLPTGGTLSATTQSGFTTADFSADTSSTTDWQSSVGVAISQPLLKNAGKQTTELNITLSANMLEDSVERFRFVMTDTVFAVITAYNRLYSYRQLLDSRSAALESAMNLLEEVRKKEKPGNRQKLDIANVEYALSQRRKELVEAERSVRDQEAHLRYLIGMEERIPVIPVDPPSREEPPESEEMAVKSAMEHRADLRQLQLAHRSSLLQERVARHQTLPDLSVTASGGITGNAATMGESYRQLGDRPGSYWSAGMLFSMPIGNTAWETDYRKSSIRADQAEQQVKSLSWRVRNEVESDMRALISARIQLNTADRTLQFATQRREEYLKQSRIGKNPVQDVINAENDLTAARNAQSDAIELFAYTVAKLWRDTGDLLKYQGITIDIRKPENLLDGKYPAFATTPVRPQSDASPTISSATKPGSGTLKTEAVKSSRQVKRTDSATKVTAAAASESLPVPKTPLKGKVPEPVRHKADTATYTLKVGEYVSLDDLEEAKRMVARAGLEPVVNRLAPKKKTMVRVMVGDYPDMKSATAEIARLRGSCPDCFVVRHGKRAMVFTGSYDNRPGAVAEQKRLAALGIRSTLASAVVKVASYQLLAGSYSSRDAAMKMVASLDSQGLKAEVEEMAEGTAKS